ncbi:MAG: hypothetical protein K0S63_108 [Gammaproteobacteria bacterium]|nr:hypothetical protein [Gammaproteobacteria bacterium]
MKKIFFHFLKSRTILLWIFLGIVSNIVFVKDTIAVSEPPTVNNSDNIPAPHTTYPLLYTMHAKKAVLIKNKENYTLVLQGLYDDVNYKFSSTNVSGTLETKKFLTMWQSKAKKDVEADVTGLQKDSTTIGHSQFYIRALLSDPLSLNKHQLKLTLLITHPKLDISKNIDMENVSLFINVCSLCFCNKTKITCDNQ